MRLYSMVVLELWKQREKKQWEKQIYHLSGLLVCIKYNIFFQHQHTQYQRINSVWDALEECSF